jgi:hypothetical protein
VMQGGGTSDDMVSVGRAIVEQLGAIRAVLLGFGTVGAFTLGAVASQVVPAPAVVAGSRVWLSPTNAAAAALMGSSKSLYHDAAVNVAGGSFTIKTADATNAAGGEQFAYIIINPR